MSRSTGPELIGNSFYQRLGFAEILADAGLSGESLALRREELGARLEECWLDSALGTKELIGDFIDLVLEELG